MKHSELLTASLSGESKHSMAHALRSTSVLAPQGRKPATLVTKQGRIAGGRAWGVGRTVGEPHGYIEATIEPWLFHNLLSTIMKQAIWKNASSM